MANISIYHSNKHMLNSLSLALSCDLSFYPTTIPISLFFLILFLALSIFLFHQRTRLNNWTRRFRSIEFSFKCHTNGKVPWVLKFSSDLSFQSIYRKQFRNFCLSSSHVDKVSIKLNSISLLFLLLVYEIEEKSDFWSKMVFRLFKCQF